MSASTTILADLATASATTPNATTKAAAIAAVGPIQDVEGHLELARIKAVELKVILTALDAVVHSSDTVIKGKIADVLASLV